MSQPAPTSCIHVPMFETRFASQMLRNTGLRSGPRAECDGGAPSDAPDEFDPLVSFTMI